jgi:PAS domain S-box-containing protein
MATFDIAALRTITILYAEDEGALRHQEIKVYNKLFKKVFEAEDGSQALELYKQHKDEIDVIVTDINMPKLSGLELAKEVQKISRVPIILTTAYTHTEYMLDAIDLGIKKYITKPVTINKIVQDIESVVTQNRKEENIKDIAKELLTKSKSNSAELDELVKENQKLDKELTYYKQLVDKYVPMMVTDKNGMILEVSGKFSKLMKYNEEELMGENISIFKSDSSTNSIQKQMLEAIHKKTTIDSTQIFQTKDDKKLTLDTKMVLFYGSDQLVAGYNFYFDLVH